MPDHIFSDKNSFLDSMVDMICMINGEGIILYINAASLNVLGYEPHEMIGQNVVMFVRPEDQVRSERVIRDLTTDRDLTYFTNRIRTKQGHIVEVEWYNTWDERRQLLFGVAKNLTGNAGDKSFLNNEPAEFIPGPSSLSIGLFKGIHPEDILAMEEAATQRLVKKGKLLRFPQFSNKYAYLLSQGVMKTVTTLEPGMELIKFLIKPGNLVGDIPILEQYERSNNYAIALQDSVVTLLDMKIITDWFTRYDFFRIKLKQQVAARIHKIEDRLSAVLHKKASERVTGFLVDFIREFGERDQEGWTAQNFLTHADVAQLCSVSRQKVSQVFSRLKKNNLIYYDKNILHIKHGSSVFTNKE
jgi:CRP/FNR family cyclic AMP-dependent transcriptional regulator